jgi:hypothetical protein
MPIDLPNKLSQNQDPQDSVDIILKILNDNGIPETLEDIYQKFKKGEPSKSSVVGKTSKKISYGTISEDEAIGLLEKGLSINNDVAKNIIKDIKEKLLPLKNNKAVSAPPIKKTKASPINIISKTAGPDAYREPIE